MPAWAINLIAGAAQPLIAGALMYLVGKGYLPADSISGFAAMLATLGSVYHSSITTTVTTPQAK